MPHPIEKPGKHLKIREQAEQHSLARQHLFSAFFEQSTEFIFSNNDPIAPLLRTGAPDMFLSIFLLILPKRSSVVPVSDAE